MARGAAERLYPEPARRTLLSVLLLTALAAHAVAAPPNVRLASSYVGLVNVATPTSVTASITLITGAASTPLYLVGIDFDTLATGLDALTAVVPAAPLAADPGGTVVFTFTIAPASCPAQPRPPPGIHHVELLVATSPSPILGDLARLKTPLVLQDLDLPPRAADWCGMAPVVSFTTDDGPFDEPSWTLAHSAALRDLDVPGTFFMTGLLGNVAQRCELARQVVADGHSVASHTYDHPDVTTLTDAQMVEQLVKNDNWFRDCLGVSPRIFRPPFGKLQPRQTQLLSTLGMTVAMWRASIDDVDPDEAYSFFEEQHNLLQRDYPGQLPSYITISHDYTETIPAVLETMVPFFRDLGYTFVSYEQCLTTCTDNLCKDVKFGNGLQRVWTYNGAVPAAPFPWANPSCGPTASPPDPTQTSAPTLGPSAGPSATAAPPTAPPASGEPCVQSGSLVYVRPPLSGVLCIVIFDESFVFLEESDVVDGVASVAATALNGNVDLVIEQYTDDSCTEFVGEATCAVVQAPSPSPGTPSPTASSPTPPPSSPVPTGTVEPTESSTAPPDPEPTDTSTSAPPTSTPTGAPTTSPPTAGPTGPLGSVTCECSCCVGDGCAPTLQGNAGNSCGDCDASCRSVYASLCPAANAGGNVSWACVASSGANELAVADNAVAIAVGAALGTVFAIGAIVGGVVLYRRRRAQKAKAMLLL